jgi:PKD repeat protein
MQAREFEFLGRTNKTMNGTFSFSSKRFQMNSRYQRLRFPGMRSFVIAVLMVTAFSLFSLQGTFGQTIRIFSAQEDEIGNAIASNGTGYFLGGAVKVNGNNYGHLLRVDSAGGLIFDRGYLLGGQTVVQSVVSDGPRVALAGYTNGGLGGTDGFLLVLDSLGDTLYQRIFGTAEDDKIFSMIRTNSGRYVLVGESKNSPSGTNENVLVVCFDSTGLLLWEKRFGGSLKECAYSVCEGQNGTLLMVGEEASFGNAVNLMTVAFSPNGTLLWSKYLFTTLNISGGDVGKGVIPTQDGGYAICGFTEREPHPTFGAWNACILKLDSTGNLVWEIAYGGINFEEFFDLEELSSGEFLAVGRIRSGVPVQNIFAMKLNSTGSPVWSRYFGPGISDTGKSLVRTNSGGFLLYGMAKDDGDGTIDDILVPIDTAGNSECNSGSITVSSYDPNMSTNNFVPQFYSGLTYSFAPISLLDTLVDEKSLCRRTAFQEILHGPSTGKGKRCGSLGPDTLFVFSDEGDIFKFGYGGNLLDVKTIDDVMVVDLSLNPDSTRAILLDRWPSDRCIVGELSPGFALNWVRTVNPSSGTLLPFGISHGFGRDYIVTAETGNGVMVLVTLDSLGQVKWAKQYGPSLLNPVRTIPTSDTSLICLIDQWSSAVNHNVFSLMRTDTLGNIVWFRSFYLNGLDLTPYDIVHTPDGGFVICGMMYTPLGREGFIVKLDSAANIQWANQYGGGWHDKFASIICTGDGGYAVTGYEDGNAFANRNVVLVKVDANGMMEWEKGYGYDSNDEGFHLAQTDDWGYVISGGVDIPITNWMQNYLVKTDLFGNSGDCYEADIFLQQATISPILLPFSPTVSAFSVGLDTPFVSISPVTATVDLLCYDCPSPSAQFTHHSILDTVFFLSTISPFDSAYWDFGDGAVGYGSSPIHVYPTSGDFEVCHTVTGECGSETFCDTVSICRVLASFTNTGTSLLCQGDSITVNNTSLNGNQVNWYFDGSFVDSAQTTSIVMTTGGSHSIVLVASDSGICVDSSSISFVSFNPPIAGFTSNPQGVSGILFVSTSQNASSLHWSFGDGSSATQSTLLHTYPGPGTYLACLIANQAACGPDTFCQWTYIACYAPAAGFSYSVQGNGETYNFTDLSVVTGSTNYAWDYGDGTTGTGPNVQHTFQNPGSYLVCLFVADSCGVDSFCQSINVSFVGTDPANIGSDIRIWPNPTSACIQIEFPPSFDYEDALIKVFDPQGKSHITEKLTIDRSRRINLDLGMLSSGTYFVAISTPNRTFHRIVLLEGR